MAVGTIFKNIVEVSKMPTARVLLIVLLSVIVCLISTNVYVAGAWQNDNEIHRSNQYRFDSILTNRNEKILECQREIQQIFKRINQEIKEENQRYKELFFKTDENYKQTQELKRETKEIKDEL